MFIKLIKDNRFWAILIPSKNNIPHKPIIHISYGIIDSENERTLEKIFIDSKKRTALQEAMLYLINKVNVQINKGYDFYIQSNIDDYNKVVDCYNDSYKD
jgi:hypothetical protein